MPRFMTIVRNSEAVRPSEPPSEDLQRRMGELFEEISKAGVMLDTAELGPISAATRIAWKGGKFSSTDGPFAETKEVVAGYSIVQVKDKAEAVEWAKRFGEIQGRYEDLELEIREIEEPNFE